jgi:hypothetical protein
MQSQHALHQTIPNICAAGVLTPPAMTIVAFAVDTKPQHASNSRTAQTVTGQLLVSIRLYASDDEAIRATGKDGSLFVRKAVRMLLRQRADRHANTGPSSTYE